MDDYIRGLRLGLLIGCGVATYVSSSAYGFDSIRTLLVFGVCFLMAIPMFVDWVIPKIRSTQSDDSSQELVYPREERRQRIQRARSYLRPVDDEE